MGGRLAARLILIMIAAAVAAGVGNGCSSREPAARPPQTPLRPSNPVVDRWQSDLLGYGRRYCDRSAIAKASTWEGGVWYYDGARVYYRTADFTGDPEWTRCAEEVLEVYRPYVLNNNGGVPGWRVFPHGLYEHYRRNGDARSRDAVLALARNSAFAAKAGGADPELSRETAYLIHAYLFAQDLGARDLDTLLAAAITNALGHLRAWTVDQTTQYVKPFMAALTAEALIHYYETHPDPRVPAAITAAADWLWRNGWREEQRSFPYLICKDTAQNEECLKNRADLAPDLNLLIAPVYAWLYFQSADEREGHRADQIFEGGVMRADLNAGKRFSQNYRWSFDYLRWRLGLERLPPRAEPRLARNSQEFG